MAIRVNMSGVQDRPEALPAGYYQAAVLSVEQKVGKDSGQPYLKWTFQVGGEGEEPYAGRKAFFNTTLAPQGLFNLKRTLKALGYEDEALQGEFEFDPNDVTGLDCTLVVVPDVYQGETVSRVDRVLPAGTSSASEG